MYAHFYHLAESPFNLTPDPKFHYINESTREAMASILHGINSRKGFISLIGEAGTGKTTLLKRIVEEIEGETLVVFVFNPGVSFDELLEFICAELGIATESRRRLALLDKLNDFLLEQLTEGRNVVVMIDEAQTLEDGVLEELRLLSNLETSKEKILQILLSGQPELEEKLRRPGLRQLRQRIAVRASLKPMRPDEIGPYVETRLRSAGADRNDFFTPAALRKIWNASKGIPRVINVICDNAMMIAFADGKRRITTAVTNEAIQDLQGVAAARGLLDGLRAWIAMPSVRYAAAGIVALALVLPLAISMVSRSIDQGARLRHGGAAPAEVAPAAPVKTVPATSVDPEASAPAAQPEGVNGTEDGADASSSADRFSLLPLERADAAPPPAPAPDEEEATEEDDVDLLAALSPPDGTPASSALPPTGVRPVLPGAVDNPAVMLDEPEEEAAFAADASPDAIRVVPARPLTPVDQDEVITPPPPSAQPAAEPSAALGQAEEMDDVVLDSIRRAEVLARSTAARLFDRGRSSLDESVSAEMARQEASGDGLGSVADLPPSMLKAAAEADALAVEAPKGQKPPPVDSAKVQAKIALARESLAEATDSLAEPLDSLVGPTEPMASADPADPDAPRSGRVLGPRDGEPIVGRLVRVLPGDTVWDIAVANYGTAGPVTLKRILNSNPRIRDPRRLEVGAHIYLPFQRPDQMVRTADNGSYDVVVAVSPQQFPLEPVRDWLRSVIQDAEMSISKVGGAQAVYQLQVLGLSSRDRALEVASDILAEYGRSRHEGASGLSDAGHRGGALAFAAR